MKMSPWNVIRLSFDLISMHALIQIFISVFRDRVVIFFRVQTVSIFIFIYIWLHYSHVTAVRTLVKSLNSTNSDLLLWPRGTVVG